MKTRNKERQPCRAIAVSCQQRRAKGRSGSEISTRGLLVFCARPSLFLSPRVSSWVTSTGRTAAARPHRPRRDRHGPFRRPSPPSLSLQRRPRRQRLYDRRLLFILLLSNERWVADVRSPADKIFRPFHSRASLPSSRPHGWSGRVGGFRSARWRPGSAIAVESNEQQLATFADSRSSRAVAVITRRGAHFDLAGPGGCDAPLAQSDSALDDHPSDCGPTVFPLHRRCLRWCHEGRRVAHSRLHRNSVDGLGAR